MMRCDESDAELAEAVKAGERNAFEELVKRYQLRVFRQCMRIARNVEVADELAQQVFLKVFDKIASFRNDAPFGAWIMRIALNAGRDHLRKHRPYETLDFEEGRDAALAVKPEVDAEVIGMRREREVLRSAIERLPDRQREVLLLRVYEDFSFKEIAASLGGTEGAAKVNFHYALKSLKGMIEAKGLRDNG